MASGEIDITPGRILDGSELITHQKLNDLAVPTLRVKPLAITARELADGSINSDKLDVNLEAQLGVPDNSVTTNKLVANAVTSSKIAADAVTTAQILDGAVTGAKLSGTGMVLQTLYVEKLTEQNTTTTAASPFTNAKGTQVFAAAAITLGNAANKVLIRVQGFMSVYSGGTGALASAVVWCNVSGTTNHIAGLPVSGYSDGQAQSFGFQYLHTPGGVGPWTYQLRFAMSSGTATPNAYINGLNYVSNNYPVLTSMTLQEIKG